MVMGCLLYTSGTRDDIPGLVRKKSIDAIYVALPSAPVDDIKDILGICQKTGCQVKYLPGVYQLMNGEVNISRLKEVEIEDLLGREPVQVNLNEIMGYVCLLYTSIWCRLIKNIWRPGRGSRYARP